MNTNTKTTRNEKLIYLVTGVLAGILLGAALLSIAMSFFNKPKDTVSTEKPALVVTTIRAQTSNLSPTFAASGSMNAWQEAIIGAESNGLRLTDIRVNVGDAVKRGQVLATFAPESVSAELAQSKANVAEAEAALAEATANAERAKTLESSGALSQQQIAQYTTAAKTAEARLTAMRANARVNEIRLAHTQVLAPDDGTISARVATVGAVVQAGQELFRLVRKNRLEWRAEVTAAELSKIAVGQKVSVATPAGDKVAGTVRMIAPTIDPQTRNVQVYVDLVPSRAAKAGMFARGEFMLGEASGLTVPQQAIVVRDGFSYVFVADKDNRVKQLKVETGRRVSDRVEVLSGIDASSNLVATGAGFLKDGDLVRLSTTATSAATTAAPTPTKK